MNNLSKTTLAISLALGLTACGGSSSDKKVTPPVVVVPPAPIKTVVDGKAIKGTMINAVVTVYKFVDGAPVALTDAEFTDAQLTTDDKGNYSFTLLDYNGPVKVELSPSTDAASPTTMICDAPLGCGPTVFGESINLTETDPSFKLSAISVVDENSNGAVKTNVSALTHLTAQLIENDSTGINATSVQQHSSAIANAFRIEGSLTSLEPTAVESAADAAAEDNANELRYGLINAGIMSALFSGETTQTGVLSTKLAAAVADLVANDGAFLVNQDADAEFELSLKDVLQGAQAVSGALATLIADDASIVNSAKVVADLTQIETNLVNEVVAEEALVGDDGRSQVGNDVPTDGGNIAKAGAMVEDVRLFANLFDVTGTANQAIGTQGDAYLALTDAAGIMIEGEAASFTLLAELSDVIANLGMQSEAGTLQGTVFPIDTLITGTQTVGSITFDPENFEFKVDAKAGDQTVKLNIALVFADDKRSINLNFDGMLESTNAQLTLSEGSKATINVDADISKQALQDNTFNGKITSGDLNLTVALGQKTTDTITNPVTFTGILSTTLKPVAVNKLNEQSEFGWVQNNDGQWEERDHLVYGKPYSEADFLPEMLNFSGEFSALAGDSVTAALTLKINDLDSYEAPKFQYIGKEIPNALSYSLSDDLTTFTLSESDNTKSKSTVVHHFTALSAPGNWNITRNITSAPGDYYELFNIEQYSRTFNSASNLTGYYISYANNNKMKADNDDGAFLARTYIFTPIDENADQIVDFYNVTKISTNDGLSYDRNNLIDDNGRLLLADGSLHTVDNGQSLGQFNSLEAFDESFRGYTYGDPTSLTNVAQYAAKRLGFGWGVEFENVGRAEIFYDKESLAALASADASKLPTSAYLTKPIIKDAWKATVSDDANTVVTTYLDGLMTTFSYSGDVVNHTLARNVTGSSLEVSDIYVVTTNNDLTVVKRSYHWQDGFDSGTFALQVEFTPVDQDNDGVMDGYTSISQYGDHFNDTGMLVDENNVIVGAGWPGESFDSFDNFDWQGDNSRLYFNPRSTNNALELFKARTAFGFKNSYSFYFDDIGDAEPTFTMDDVNAITAGSSVSFDMLNTRAASTSAGIENQNVFLQGNAALSVDLMLGDYQVGLQLSGERTAFKDAKFDLAMRYKLPDDTAQRSFTVHANTDQNNTIAISNAEDVHVTLTEISAEAQSSGESVLGVMTVGTGDAAVEVAKIVNRDGIVLVVYSDGSVESL